MGSISDIPFPENQFDVVMCSFMIFHMSDETRRKGIAEIHRVLKPQGRLLLLDLALPDRPLPRAIAKRLLGGMEAPDLRDLIPILTALVFQRSNLAPHHSEFWVFLLSVTSVEQPARIEPISLVLNVYGQGRFQNAVTSRSLPLGGDCGSYGRAADRRRS